jgi:hypothetical protein
MEVQFKEQEVDQVVMQEIHKLVEQAEVVLQEHMNQEVMQVDLQ